MDKTEQYLTSMYFIITTFATVGYGDISANNKSEKIFCIFVMIGGVTAFAAGTSTLTNILSTFDLEDKSLQDKIDTLNEIYNDYYLPLQLYENVKKSIKYQHNTDMDHIIHFVSKLPQDLRLEVNLFIFEKTFKQFKFFVNRPVSFIAWICPLLRPLIKSNDQYIFFEGDDISCIYFLQKGNAGYVLPRHENLLYIRLTAGLHFGVSCIVGSFMEEDNFDIDSWIIFRDKL